MMNCKLKFIDLFAGCGGLSLGLMNAGLEGIFAIEKTEDAFKTLIHNLDHKKIKNGYKWPIWLPQKNMTTRDLLDNYQSQLQELKDKVDLIAGGPPCQGFSFAGLRNPNDPRNRLTEEYIEIVSIICGVKMVCFVFNVKIIIINLLHCVSYTPNTMRKRQYYLE